MQDCKIGTRPKAPVALDEFYRRLFFVIIFNKLHKRVNDLSSLLRLSLTPLKLVIESLAIESLTPVYRQANPLYLLKIISLTISSRAFL
jgi:hypothetical protein